MTATKHEIWTKCSACGWVWVAYAPLPAPLDIAVRAMTTAQCPSCGRGPKGILMATAAEIASKQAQVRA